MKDYLEKKMDDMKRKRKIAYMSIFTALCLGVAWQLVKEYQIWLFLCFSATVCSAIVQNTVYISALATYNTVKELNEKGLLVRNSDQELVP